MPRQPEILSPAQRTRFEKAHESLTPLELARHYTLSESDVAFIESHRRDHNRLGCAIQLCFLRFPGRPLQPDEVVPTALLAFVARQLGLPTECISAYGERETTRREHLLEIRQVFGFRPYNSIAETSLAKWLLPIAMNTRLPEHLVDEVLCEMRAQRIVVPALSTVEKLVWHVRRKAESRIYKRLTDSLTATQRLQIRQLTELRENGRTSWLDWLKKPPRRPSPKSFQGITRRLGFIRRIGLDPALARTVHQSRLSQLAREGAKYTGQHLDRFQGARREATLVAFLLEATQDLTDQAIAMHDRMMGLLFSRSERVHLERFSRSGKAINEKVMLYANVGRAVIQAHTHGLALAEAIESVLSWERFTATVEEAARLARPADFDSLADIKSRYPQLRQYTPLLLENFEFRTASSLSSLARALEILKGLNETSQRKLPSDAPTDFIKPRWKKHVETDEGLNRPFYEMCVLSELRNGLRSGDIWVLGSKQYRDFEDHLLPAITWRQMKDKEEVPLAVEVGFESYIAKRQEQLHKEMLRVEKLISRGKLVDVKLEDDVLRITPLSKAVPEEAERLAADVYRLLPRIKLTDLLVEVDAWTGLSGLFTHLHTGNEATDKPTLLAAILADATNLGLTRMADACPGLTFEKLAWASEWYVREETYAKALSELVNFQHRLPMASHWGQGKTSSSDGQAFRIATRRGSTAHTNAKYGNEPSVMFYTHVSDQYAPFHTKVIHSTVRDATHVLDGLLYHKSELSIEEHYTDTHGYTDHIFALCHLLGFRFAPRIRDLKDKKLYGIQKPSTYPGLNSLLSDTPVNLRRIEENWDDVLRLASSIRTGTVTASMMIRKLAAYPRQNGIAVALREIGRIEKTLFTLEWLQDPALRRRVLVGLNKGESKNALAREICRHRLGEISDRSLDDQWNKAGGLNFVIAAIVLWNTVYMGRAVEELRRRGREASAEMLAHVAPLGWEHIVLTGEYHWDLRQATTLEKLRPLRFSAMEGERAAGP